MYWLHQAIHKTIWIWKRLIWRNSQNHMNLKKIDMVSWIQRVTSHCIFNVMLPFEFKYVLVSIGRRTQTFNFHIWWLKGYDDIWKGFDMKLSSWRPYHSFCKNLLISAPISNHWKKQNCHLHSIVKIIIFYNLTFSFSKNSCLSNDDKGFKHDIKSIVNDIHCVIQKRTCDQNNLILISH